MVYNYNQTRAQAPRETKSKAARRVASWAWTGGGAYRIKVEGRDAERQAGKQFTVTRRDGTNPVSVILINLIEWSAGGNSSPPSAFYSYRRAPPTRVEGEQ
jgi:hypothetical protein